MYSAFKMPLSGAQTVCMQPTCESYEDAVSGDTLVNMLQKFSQFFGDCHYDYELSDM